MTHGSWVMGQELNGSWVTMSDPFPALHGGMVILQLPLEVFTQRNFVADFIRLILNIILKNKKSLFEPHFGDLRVTYTFHLYTSLESPSGRPIRHN